MTGAIPFYNTSKRIEKSPESLLAEMKTKRKEFAFTPYTLNDYKLIRTDKYYELGGLGPMNIGTEE